LIIWHWNSAYGISHLEILPFGELHVGLLQQGAEVGAVPLEPLQTSERARRVRELAVVLVRPERQIPCVKKMKLKTCTI
jgi:hypothetical protein